MSRVWVSLARMRTAAFLTLLLLGPCDKTEASGDPASGSAAPTGTTTAAATVTAAGTAAGTAAAGGTGGAAAAGTGAAAAATIGTEKKGVMTNTDGGLTIVNDDKNKKLNLDGGTLTLNNNSGQGSVTQTDAGVVLKGKDGKTLTLPPVPGLK
jgi:hypothetical protein